MDPSWKSYERSGEAVLVADPGQRYVWVNAQAARLYGVTRPDLIGHTISEFNTPLTPLSTLWKSFMRTGRYAGFTWMHTASGHRIASIRARADLLPGRHVAILSPPAGADYDPSDPWSRIDYLAAALLRARSPDDLGEIVTARGWEVSREAHAAGLFIRAAGGHWRLAETGLASATGLGAWLAGPAPFAALLSAAARRASPLVLATARAIERLAPGISAAGGAGMRRLQAMILIPVRRRGRTLACLVFAFPRPRTTSSDVDLEIFDALASLCAEAMHRLAQLSDVGSNDAGDAFVAMAAHELKGPVTTALMHVDVVQRLLTVPSIAAAVTEVEPVRSSVANARAGLESLNHLVGVLADAARGIHRPETLERVATDLAVVIRRAVKRAEGNGTAAPPIDLTLEDPLWIQCDATQIERVLDNLLGNALEYGEGKPISIVADTAAGGVRFRITDRGIGIAPADRRRIFDRFERGSRGAGHPGLGLGLWLGRMMVEAHGGRLRVESAPGEGSTFELWLPGWSG